MSDQPRERVYNFTSLFLIATVISLGVFFRFSNLSAKVFWVDEVATAVRVSGYTISQVTDELSSQDTVDRDTLLFYQNLNPQRTFGDSLAALIKSPEHTPLYFLLARLWRQGWGNSIGALRSLSVIFSLLIVPGLYWLCQELFKRSQISWLAVGIMSISPFYVAYAQEARPYSLWTVTILLMGASFFRALRLNRPSAWILHIFCLVLSFYTSLFSIYLAGFQGLYLIFTSKPKNLKIVRNYFYSLLIAFLAFSPWIWVIVNHLDLLHDNTSWMRGNFNLAEIIAVYIGTNLLIFGDLPISSNSNPIQIAVVLGLIVITLLAGIKFATCWQKKPFSGSYLLILLLPLLLTQINLDWVTLIGALVAIAILSLSVYSLYYLITKTNRDRWLYIICLMLSLPLPLLLTDIINQGQSSTAPRYLIPLQLGILLAVAYTLGSQLNASKTQFWQFTLGSFLILGVYSNLRNLNLSPFYQKNRNVNNLAIAKVINQTNSALLLVDADATGDALSLAYSLSPKVKYKIITAEKSFNLSVNKFDQVYLLKPSLRLKQKLQQDPTIELKQVYKSPIFSQNEFPLDLWTVTTVFN